MCKEALAHMKRDLGVLVLGFYESLLDFPYHYKGIIQFVLTSYVVLFLGKGFNK